MGEEGQSLSILLNCSKSGGAEGVKGAIGNPPCRLRRGENFLLQSAI